MLPRPLSRRDALRGSVALAAYSLASRPLRSFGLEPAPGETVVPFLDVQPVGKMLYWQKLTSWITPNPDLYEVSHYGRPKIDPSQWKLDVTGYVRSPKSFSLEDLKRRRTVSIHATLECGGNGSSPGFSGAIGNIKWTGTPLAPILRECGLVKRSKEVVFFGADQKVEKISEKEYPQQFARSLSLDHALQDHVMVCWAMNDEPLNDVHGAPVRLIVPGWFGVAWVKWLTRIELLDRRFMGKWMASSYVTLRGDELPDHSTLWKQTSVCNLAIKSITARTVRRPDGVHRISGAAWSDGTPLSKVELRIDDGPWQAVTLEKKPRGAKYTWSLWHFDWRDATPGEHTIVSRATDADGRTQPSAEDPVIKNKRTYYEANQQWVRKIRIA